MKHFILMLICICKLTYLFATDNISFKHLGIKEGLSHSQVNHIFKDSRGFIWISTASGLNRYDGYNFKVFKRDNQSSSSLIDNFVDNVQEDAGGGLWIHARALTYTYYDPQKETFQPAEERLSSIYGIKHGPHLIYIDKKKNIWCHTNAVGTYQYNVATRKLLFYPVDEANGLSNQNVRCITEDRNGIIYLYESGLIEYLDPNSNQVSHRNRDLLKNPGKLFPEYSMFVDAQGDYWVYAKDQAGLWIYYTQENRWEHCSTQYDSHYVLSHDIVCDVKQDNKGQIWIATDHGGVNIINKELHTISHIVNDPLDCRSLQHNSIICLYCDENGDTWVGTYKRGISFYSESIFKFKSDLLPDFGHIKNFTADVNVIVQDKLGNLWFGTNSSGILCLNRETGKQKIYQHSSNKNSLSYNTIVSMLATKDGKIWAGTFKGGLNVIDGDNIINYQHNPNNPNSLSNNHVWALAEGDNGHIWIGTLGKGLQKLDPQTGVFTSYAEPDTEFATDNISSICIGKDKKLYMSTATGLTVFTPTTGKFEKWQGNKKGTTSFSNLNINQIYEDSRGLLWLATQEGINVYDRKKDEIVTFHNESGLSNKVTYAIVEDNNKNIWITTPKEIVNIVVNVDPKNGIYTYTPYHYDELDGLQEQEFNLRSIIKTFRGEIIAGGLHGLSSFNPESLKYNDNVPRVTFTGLQLFNEDVKIDSVYNGNRILTKAINQTDKIALEYKQNVFSISFSSMNYILPEKTTYQYMLEGFNTNWLTADANKVTYTNLTPGKYTLKVKATNSDGFSNDEASELQIVIRPPFWSSPWAYVIYFLIIIGILFIARWQLLRSERSKFQLVQIEQEAQQKHEIDDMKLRFFTNISHELRTPLTLIISPLENVIKSIGDKEQKHKLEMVHRNAIRLLNMVNQLLDFRKSDVKGHQLNPSQGDIVEFVHNISNSFIEFSEKKNVHLTFFSGIKELSIVFDEDKMGKIIMNLLSNAFKFTNAGGRVDVYMSLHPATDDQPEQLEIKISDTGIGIKDEDKERIFERFYQVQHSDSGKSGGSGVGLHLVKEFVTLHDGTVKVVDNIGHGSVFIVTLPIRSLTPALSRGEGWGEASGEAPLILIVDDSDDFRLFMKDSLKADYQIKEATDGAKAWELIPTLQPDIIVSDVMMPEIDGIELCKLVKTDIRTSHIPLILLTARSAEEQKLEGLESGADDYITKPFNFEILSLRIKKLLQLRQKRQENFSGKMEVNPSEITITSLDEKLIQKAIQYVEDNIARCELSVEELSRELGMSRVHLYKKLLSITGKSPIEFIRVIRLKRAAQLLRQSQQNVSEIAYQVGFNSPKYFSKYFKEEFGVLPSAYQDKEKI
ncbi:hybrid sensor histidine kinase/response regulator transcription factor [Bacteroides sp. 51]|uniref:hybrid sensor histidine kinase/response regulator transcription factor n=1 Tax=Bacteroides sp. 51 TaxID=2302938 RepID=UPI0013D0199D|nr:hybrid sensor histidine kinase/response regulator transcription factor [Bacteroides sp. 51]NDV83786.1 hybrid sensor histidine kinase/response regulator [Bacteroides sp. 51]